MSYPWIHESETAAAHAEHDAGDLLGEEGRRIQRRVEAALEVDPGLPRLADARFLERWGTERPHPEADAPEAGS